MSFRPEHYPSGDPCEHCALPAGRHRTGRSRTEYHRRYSARRTTYRREYQESRPRPKNSLRIIGIDGEGQGRESHVYNFIAAADEEGKTWQLGEDRTRQLSTEDILDFLLDLPGRSLVIAFAFLYDLTKALEDLPDQQLGDLFHEKRRLYFKNGRARYRPVRWKGYKLNFINRRLTIAKDTRRVTVWDVFAFFQSKFTKALLDWKVGNGDELRAIEKMKDQRADLDALPFAQVKDYCKSECKNLATLGRALLDAHERVDLVLKSYFGCGSTASALMNRHNVRDFKGDAPTKMRLPVACGFFGGWFENAVLGAVRRPVWNADINAAYPYALYGMPCLTHGRWEWVTTNLERKMSNARLALIHWCNPGGQGPKSWGPLPVRCADGTIKFPLAAVEGWTWREEFLAARAGWPSVEALGAWVYNTDCDCKPFGFMGDVYLQRLRFGSDTAGLPLKNGMNSGYGKLVQTLGENPPFQSFVWGGNCTSHCRSQLLGAIISNPDHVLMVATDGIVSDTPLKLSEPRDTGTKDATRISGGKKGPLGAWEVKAYPKGYFFARPGIYFPLDFSNDEKEREEELKKVRGRGLGRKVLYDNIDRVVDGWANGEEIDVGKGRKVPGVQLPPVGRFVGAKTGLNLQGNKWVRSKTYGKWVKWPARVSFDPQPKRRSVLPGGRLEPWPRLMRPSLPYVKANVSDEVRELQMTQTMAEEQPNGEYED